MTAHGKAYAETLLEETREELTRADAKASLLFAASGVVAGAVLAGIINGKWAPGDLQPWATVTFAVGAGLYAAAVCCLGYAVWPRITHEEATRPAAYFGDIVNYRGSEKRQALRNALERGASNPERTISQLVILSGIVWRKYIGIRMALRCFAMSLSLCAVAVIAG